MLVKPCLCPLCGYFMDAATCVSAETLPLPKSGDISMCLSCGAALVFNKDLSLRLMTEDERLVLPPNINTILARMDSARSAVVTSQRPLRDRGSA